MKTIILAGGQSSRMGRNKALMKIGGVRVVDRIVAEFTPVSDELILITNDLAPYKGVKAKILEDAQPFKRQGPLAGMYTGLKEVGRGPCLVVACDMPFVSAKLGCALVSELKIKRKDAVVPLEDQIQPLFAAYDAQIAEKVKETLEDGKRSVRALLDRIDIELYKMKETDVTWNMNTMADYIQALEIEEGRDRNDM